ncbi:RMD1 family protein [Sulfuriflexus mobilis]|uniref:RMD1 family protein n=1 Tax=Sulfuriflexus mobilis TaxID=1811807 RepID=UPI000F819DF9|nr:RMD1 family protein [Sulfuriflexus mobilis]
MVFSNDRLSAFNLGDVLLALPGEQDLLNNIRGARYRDAVLVSLPGGEAWVFDYGVVVFWAVDEDERQAFLNSLQLDNAIIEGARQEHFRFTTSGQEVRIHQDTITLTDDNPLTRLAISHALAQSLKLTEYELQAQGTIQNHSNLPEALATTGKIALSRSEIAKIRGRLFSTKSDIILHYGLLDTPDFFWEYPEFESTYNIAARYMQIHQRVELLSKKLETIHELFEMLADEQKHQHSSFLEWIIIILIAIEIIIFGAKEIQTLIQ